MRLDQTVDKAIKFAFLFKRWIDQHHAAFFLRRKVSAKRKPAVKLGYANLIITVEEFRQLGGILRMQFQRGQAVLFAQQMSDDKRRARIMAKLFTFIDRTNGSEIGFQQLQHGLLDLPFFTASTMRSMPPVHSPVLPASIPFRS